MPFVAHPQKSTFLIDEAIPKNVSKKQGYVDLIHSMKIEQRTLTAALKLSNCYFAELTLIRVTQRKHYLK